MHKKEREEAERRDDTEQAHSLYLGRMVLRSLHYEVAGLWKQVHIGEDELPLQNEKSCYISFFPLETKIC